jgi:hypothetical protein
MLNNQMVIYHRHTYPHHFMPFGPGTWHHIPHNIVALRGHQAFGARVADTGLGAHDGSKRTVHIKGYQPIIILPDNSTPGSCFSVIHFLGVSWCFTISPGNSGALGVDSWACSWGTPSSRLPLSRVLLQTAEALKFFDRLFLAWKKGGVFPGEAPTLKVYYLHFEF